MVLCDFRRPRGTRKEGKTQWSQSLGSDFDLSLLRSLKPGKPGGLGLAAGKVGSDKEPANPRGLPKAPGQRQ